MINLILGISLTLNVVFIVGIIIYFKIKAFGFYKVQKDLIRSFGYTDEELEENDFLSDKDNSFLDRL